MERLKTCLSGIILCALFVAGSVQEIPGLIGAVVVAGAAIAGIAVLERIAE